MGVVPELLARRRDLRHRQYGWHDQALVPEELMLSLQQGTVHQATALTRADLLERICSWPTPSPVGIWGLGSKQELMAGEFKRP